MNSWIKYFLLPFCLLGRGEFHPTCFQMSITNGTSCVSILKNKTLILRSFLQENLDLLYL